MSWCFLCSRKLEWNDSKYFFFFKYFDFTHPEKYIEYRNHIFLKKTNLKNIVMVFSMFSKINYPKHFFWNILISPTLKNIWNTKNIFFKEQIWRIMSCCFLYSQKLKRNYLKHYFEIFWFHPLWKIYRKQKAQFLKNKFEEQCLSVLCFRKLEWIYPKHF